MIKLITLTAAMGLSMHLLGQSRIPGSFNSTTQLFHSTDTTIYSGWFSDGLGVYGKGGYLGLLDSSGEIICPPKYDKIYPFDGSVARTVLNGNLGLINKQGKELCEPVYDDISVFEDGLGIVQKGWRYGIINAKGKLVTKVIYSTLDRRPNGEFVYLKDSIVGKLNNKFKEIELYNVRRDKPIVTIHKTLYIANKGYKAPLLAYHEGLTTYFKKGLNGYLFGFMDEDMKPVIKAKYDWVDSFNTGYAMVLQKDKWGIIDKEGNVVVQPKYKSIRYACKNRYIVSEDSIKYGIIDALGNQILGENYIALHYLFDDLYAVAGKFEKEVELHNPYYRRVATGWGVVAETGETILPMEYIGVGRLSDSTGIVSKYISCRSLNTGIPRFDLFGSYTTFDRSGLNSKAEGSYAKVIEGVSDWYNGYVLESMPAFYLPRSYSSIESNIMFSQRLDSGLRFIKVLANKSAIVAVSDTTKRNVAEIKSFIIHSGYSSFSTEQKFGIVDANSSFIVPPIYDQILDEGLTVFVVKKDGNYGVIDIHNNMIIPIQYSYISISESLILVRKKLAEYEYEHAIFDLTGDMLIPFTACKYCTPFHIYNGSIVYSKNRENYRIDKKGVRLQNQ